MRSQQLFPMGSTPTASTHFLGHMNEKRFEKSLARWCSFIEAVDLEVCSHTHVDSVFDLPENLGRIAMVSCPSELDKTPSRSAQELDKTPSRSAQDFDTNCVSGCLRRLQVEMKSENTAPHRPARVHVLGQGSLNAGTLVCQVLTFHSMVLCRRSVCHHLLYKACSNVLVSTKKLHMRNVPSAKAVALSASWLRDERAKCSMVVAGAGPYPVIASLCP